MTGTGFFFERVAGMYKFDLEEQPDGEEILPAISSTATTKNYRQGK